MLANKYYFIFVQVALKSSCSQCLIRFHIPTYIYSLGHSQVILKNFDLQEHGNYFCTSSLEQDQLVWIVVWTAALLQAADTRIYVIIFFTQIE